MRSRLALAGMYVHLLVAVAAADGTAPVELALALGGAADARRVVASTAAHHPAVVCAAGCPVAEAPRRPHGSCGGTEHQRISVSDRNETRLMLNSCFETKVLPDTTGN